MGTALLSWWLCGSPCAPILQETPLKTSGLLRGRSPPPSLVSARLRPGWDQLEQQLRFVLSLLEIEICTREPRDGRSAGFPTEDHRHQTHLPCLLTGNSVTARPGPEVWWDCWKVPRTWLFVPSLPMLSAQKSTWPPSALATREPESQPQTPRNVTFLILQLTLPP